MKADMTYHKKQGKDVEVECFALLDEPARTRYMETKIQSIIKLLTSNINGEREIMEMLKLLLTKEIRNAKKWERKYKEATGFTYYDQNPQLDKIDLLIDIGKLMKKFHISYDEVLEYNYKQLQEHLKR